MTITLKTGDVQTNAARALQTSFTWYATTEGCAFWRSLYLQVAQ